MIASAWHLRIAQKTLIAGIGIASTVGLAFAVPPTLNSSGLSAQQCYRRDSDCTQFCGQVTGPMRYECFGICDRMLDNCLSTGDWTDSLSIDPGTDKPPTKPGLLTGMFMQMLMVLSDSDGDGVLTQKELDDVKQKLKGGDIKPIPNTPPPIPDKP